MADNDSREKLQLIAQHRIAQGLKSLLLLHDVHPPEDHYIELTSVSVDTDEMTGTFSWTYLECLPDFDGEEE